MTGLLIKDWKLFKNQGRYFFTILMIAIAILIMGSERFNTFAISYITFFVAYFALSTLSYDEYDNGMEFLMTLPVSRRTYVSEKYLLTVLLTAGAWLFSIGINVVFLLSSGSSAESFREMLGAGVLFLPITLAFLDVSLPLFLKFGPELGRVVSFGVIGVIVLLLFLLGRTGIGVPQLHGLHILLSADPAMLFAVCILGSILFTLISYMISIKLMGYKEF